MGSMSLGRRVGLWCVTTSVLFTLLLLVNLWLTPSQQLDAARCVAAEHETTVSAAEVARVLSAAIRLR
jgi:hypothetical protein